MDRKIFVPLVPEQQRTKSVFALPNMGLIPRRCVLSTVKLARGATRGEVANLSMCWDAAEGISRWGGPSVPACLRDVRGMGRRVAKRKRRSHQ